MEKCGQHADTYSLGVILCSLVFDELPFESCEAALAGEPHLPLEDEQEGMQLVLWTMIKKLLAKNTEKRTTVEGLGRVIAFL